MLAIDPAKFGGIGSEFVKGMKKYVSDIKAPSPDTIRYAGENAAATAVDRLDNGIPIDAALEKELQTLAAEVSYKLDLGEVLTSAAKKRKLA